MTHFIGWFCIGGIGGQMLNAFSTQSHPDQELHYLTIAIYSVAAAISFKKVDA